ncbi:MAG: hypothetical protein PHW04_02025 [Candidatus Wallbacteria bacterium]|nr:hypothetical protein [Candidatus Wallbacteria bacterium]
MFFCLSHLRTAEFYNLFHYSIYILILYIFFTRYREKSEYRLNLDQKADLGTVRDFFFLFLFSALVAFINYVCVVGSLNPGNFFHRVFFGFFNLENIFRANYLLLLYAPFYEELVFRFFFYNLFFELSNIGGYPRRFVILSEIYLLFFAAFFRPLFPDNHLQMIVSSLLFFLFMMILNQGLTLIHRMAFEKRVMLLNVVFFASGHFFKFYLYHGGRFAFTLALYILFSILVNLLYQRKKSIVYPLWLHFVWNFWMILPSCGSFPG